MSSGNSPKISIDQLVLKSLYYRYQRFVMPVSTIGICLLLFWFVVIPQMQNWFALRDGLTVDEQNLQVMHQNLAIITALDDAKLDQTLTTATNALPTEKDFAGILSSLQNAAAISGVALGDYTFQLGDLSGLDQQGKATQLPVQLNVILKGTIADAQHFVKQLKNQLPLSDTIAVTVNSNTTATVTVIFYYASLPKIVFQDSVPLPVLGSVEQNLLDGLSASNTTNATQLASPTALPIQITPTAVPTISPTIPVISPTKAATTSAQ